MLNQDYQNDQFELDPDQTVITPLKRSKPELVEVAATTSSNNRSVLPRVHSKGNQLERNYSHQTIKDNPALPRTSKRDKSDTLQPISNSLESHTPNLQNKKRQRSLYNRSQTQQAGLKSHSNSLLKANRRRSELQLKIEQKKGILKRQLKGHDKRQLAILLKSQSQKIQQHFHHSKADLVKLSVDEINRLNYKVRQWIAKLNSELDHRINEALRQKQTAKPLKEKSSEQMVNLLESQVLNNQDRLALLENEESKLRQQDYQYEEEYNVCLDEEKETIRGKLQKLTRIIVELRTLTGKKAGQLVHESPGSQPSVDSVKQQIVKVKGQCSRNQDALGKLDAKYSQLTQNMQRLNTHLSNKMNQAKQNNISLGQNHLQEVFKSLKEKIDKSRTQIIYLESKVGKHITKAQNQLKLLKNEAAHYDRDTLQVQQKIDKIAAQALELISNNNQSGLLSENRSVVFFNKYMSPNDKNFVPFSTNFKNQKVLQKDTGLITIKESESSQAQPRRLSPEGNEEDFQNQFMNVENRHLSQIAHQKQNINIDPKEEGSKTSHYQNHQIVPVEEKKTLEEQVGLADKKAEVKGDTVSGDQVATISPKRFRFKRNQARVEPSE